MPGKVKRSISQKHTPRQRVETLVHNSKNSPLWPLKSTVGLDSLFVIKDGNKTSIIGSLKNQIYFFIWKKQ